ncbi:S24/S26 family peptidase [Sphingomonas sp. MMS24-JH45]
MKGDSMNQLLPEGGWAVVDPDQRHLYYGRVYLIENEDRETTVKRYCGDPGPFQTGIRQRVTPADHSLRRQAISSDRAYRGYGNTAGL